MGNLIKQIQQAEIMCYHTESMSQKFIGRVHGIFVGWAASSVLFSWGLGGTVGLIILIAILTALGIFRRILPKYGHLVCNAPQILAGSTPNAPHRATPQKAPMYRQPRVMPRYHHGGRNLAAQSGSMMARSYQLRQPAHNVAVALPGNMRDFSNRAVQQSKPAHQPSRLKPQYYQLERIPKK